MTLPRYLGLILAGMHDANARAGPGLAGSGGTGEADSPPLAPGLLSGGRAQRRAASPETPVLLSDPAVSAVSVRDCAEPLTALAESFGPSRALVRASVARRLVLARDELPRGVGLRVVAGHRTAEAQRAIISSYAAGLRMVHPAIGAAELGRLTSRFVSPVGCRAAPRGCGSRPHARRRLRAAATGPRDPHRRDPGGERRTAAGCGERGIGPDAPARPRAPPPSALRARPGQLPDRVVALELRRPVLGPAHRRPGTRRTARSQRGGRRMSAAIAPGPRLERPARAPYSLSTCLRSRPTPALRLPHPREVMAVVKADGFGHGGAEAARTALGNGATWLGVTSRRRPGVAGSRARRADAELAQPGRCRLRARGRGGNRPRRARPRASERGRRAAGRTGTAPRCICTSTSGWPVTASRPPSGPGCAAPRSAARGGASSLSSA